MNKDVLNVREVADTLRISHSFAYKLCKCEDFPSINLGRRIIIPRTALEEWLKANAIKQYNINNMEDVSYECKN